MAKRNRIHRTELIDNLRAQRRLLNDSLKRLDGHPMDAEEAIELAIGISDDYERLDFLKAYNFGDWSTVIQYMEREDGKA